MLSWLLYGPLLSFLLTGKKVLVVPVWKGERNNQECNKYCSIVPLSLVGKVLAHLLFMLIPSQLLNLMRPEQSRLTNDHTLAVHVLVVLWRVFQQGMVGAFIVLKKAFSELLWFLVTRVLTMIVGLLTGLYSMTMLWRVGPCVCIRQLSCKHWCEAELSLPHHLTTVVCSYQSNTSQNWDIGIVEHLLVISAWLILFLLMM